MLSPANPTHTRHNNNAVKTNSRPLLTGEDFAKGVEESKKHAGRALGKILPLGAQVAASAVAYSAGITATQVCGSECVLCVGLEGFSIAD